MNAYRNAVMRNPGCFEGKVGANPPSARAHAERPEAVCELVRLAHNISHRPFAGRRQVVLDVGAGSGVLAIWAAKAGAKRVFAVEATSMAVHARRLAEQNGVGHIVEILEGYMEQQSLPQKVDIIISEWMGYFLLRESMFDSVIAARDVRGPQP